MKKTFLALCLVVLAPVLALPVTILEKTDTTPGFSLSGTFWLRHTLKYQPNMLVTNQLGISRNYISAAFSGKDMDSNVTLDIVNSSGAQKAGDFQVWVKLGYIDFTAIPFLSDAGIKLRAGIQPNYFGTGNLWAYNIYEVPVEDRVSIPSADMGLSLLGKIPEKLGTYELALYSGNGYKFLDTDFYKALACSLTVGPIEGASLKLSYHKNAGITPRNAEADDFSVTGIMAMYKNGMIDSYIEFLEKLGPRTAGKTGVRQVVSGYVSVKPVDFLSLNARVDIDNPDTGASDDEMNYYYAGINIPVAEKATLMLNYKLGQKRIQKVSDRNENMFITQVKWTW